MASFILGLLHPKPSHRLTAAAALQHSFLWDTTCRTMLQKKYAVPGSLIPSRYGKHRFMQHHLPALSKCFATGNMQQTCGGDLQVAVKPAALRALSDGQKTRLWQYGCDMLVYKHDLPQHMLPVKHEAVDPEWRAYHLAKGIIVREQSAKQGQQRFIKLAAPIKPQVTLCLTSCCSACFAASCSKV